MVRSAHLVSLDASTLQGRRDPVPSDSRYECLLKIASGGMATVYVGRLRGAKGFWRLVAIKRAHAHLVGDEVFRRALIAEAQLASHIHHPNVVSVVDVEEPSEELLLVMDYVEGASLSQLITTASKKSKHLPPEVVVRIVLDAAAGLHAAHELKDEHGAPLAIVHRDVSPQNILVGVDGSSRIADFGIAKCADSGQATQTGLKGKVGYMAPEYIKARQIDRRGDVFALGVVAWEALAGQRLFKGLDELGGITAVLDATPGKLPSVAPWVPPELDECIQRALLKDPDARYADALAFARDLEAAAKAAGLDASPAAVTTSVRELFGEVLDERRETLRGLLTKAPGAASVPPPAVAAEGARGIGEVTRTRTVDVRASISDARTQPFLKLKDDGGSPTTGDHTQDLTALADVPGAPSSAAAPSRRRAFVAGVVGLVCAAAIALGVSRRDGASPSDAAEASRASEPTTARDPHATTSPASPGATASIDAPSSPSATPASMPSQTAPSASQPAASASGAPGPSATPNEPSGRPRQAPAGVGTAKTAPKSGLGTRPDRPGLGY